MVSTRQMTITTGPVEEVFTTLGTKMPSTSTASIVEHKVKQTELLNLPVEILDKIFSYTGYKKIGQMRTVSLFFLFIRFFFFVFSCWRIFVF